MRLLIILGQHQRVRIDGDPAVLNPHSFLPAGIVRLSRHLICDLTNIPSNRLRRIFRKPIRYGLPLRNTFPVFPVSVALPHLLGPKKRSAYRVLVVVDAPACAPSTSCSQRRQIALEKQLPVVLLSSCTGSNTPSRNMASNSRSSTAPRRSLP